jgi:ketosteroid isomerase-like protein
MSAVAGGTEEVVRAYVAACNGDDLEAALALLHPEIELHEAETLPGAVDAVGFEEVRRYLERFDTHWSSFNWEPLELEFTGDRALMRARLQLVGRKSGIEVDREWIYVFVVRDGKLARQDGFDQMDDARAAFEHGGGG